MKKDTPRFRKLVRKGGRLEAKMDDGPLTFGYSMASGNCREHSRIWQDLAVNAEDEGERTRLTNGARQFQLAYEALVAEGADPNDL